MMFDILLEPQPQIDRSMDRVEIFTDFRGEFLVTKIYENSNPNMSNYELFREMYSNLDPMDVIIDMPDLEPNKRYSLEFRVEIETDYFNTDSDCYVYYREGTLKELK